MTTCHQPSRRFRVPGKVASRSSGTHLEASPGFSGAETPELLGRLSLLWRADQVRFPGNHSKTSQMKISRSPQPKSVRLNCSLGVFGFQSGSFGPEGRFSPAGQTFDSTSSWTIPVYSWKGSFLGVLPRVFRKYNPSILPPTGPECAGKAFPGGTEPIKLNNRRRIVFR